MSWGDVKTPGRKQIATLLSEEAHDALVRFAAAECEGESPFSVTAIIIQDWLREHFDETLPEVPTRGRCQHTMPNGEQCKKFFYGDWDYCTWHAKDGAATEVAA